LIRIPSVNPPGDEREVADFVVSELEQVGIDVRVQHVKRKRPNVIGIVDQISEKHGLMLNAHMDTVQACDGWSIDPFKGRIKSGRLYGLGACDMKGALASMICAAKALKRSRIQLKSGFLLTAVVDEEVGQTGARALVADAVTAGSAVVGESTDMAIGVAHKGLLRIEIKTVGRAAHGSVPGLGINAIEKSARVLALLQDVRKNVCSTSHVSLGKAIMNIGVIQGGIAANIVPDSCKIEVDFRTLPSQSAETILAEINSRLEKLRKIDSRFHAHAKILKLLEPMEISRNQDIVQALSAAIMTIAHKRARIAGLPYWTDASTLVNVGLIPTAVCGPGRVEGGHEPDEWIGLRALVDATKVYATAAFYMCKDLEQSDSSPKSKHLV